MTTTSGSSKILETGSSKSTKNEEVIEKPEEAEMKPQNRGGNSESGAYCEFHLSMVASFLPAPIAEYIIERFCDDMDVDTYKKVDFDTACPDCIKTQKRMVLRRHYERTMVNNLKDKQSSAYFVVSAEWLMKWRLYLYYDTEDDKFLKRYFFDSLELPGPIYNEGLLEEDGQTLIEDLELVKFGLPEN
jgi:hypothetical protein